MNIYSLLKSSVSGLLLFSLLASLSACSNNDAQLERIQSRGILRIALITSPPLYFPDESLLKGYDYEIISAYSESIGTELQITHANTLSEIATLLKQGKVHIGIAGNTPNYPDDNILNSIAYDESAWYVIGNRDDTLPKSVEDIAPGTLITAKGSAPALIMANLKKKHPELYGLALPDSNTRQILEQVDLGTFKLSIINADVYQYYRYLYPEIKVAFNIETSASSQWHFLKNEHDVSLSNSINRFLDSYKKNKLDALHTTYFQHLNAFDYVDSVYYLKRIKTKLPKYSHHFKKAANDNEFDERFLAAISYQESHWNQLARSHTGVRGLMMLTLDTAKRVGVNNRLDPVQSITGGAKYLNILKASLPDRIPEPDRSWMTLAAYNVGLGHLEDARILTEQQGDDADRWIDVAKHLPKLSQLKWYKKTKYGYARGREPVKFVKRIRRYYDVLRLYQQEEILEKRDKPLDMEKLNINSLVF